MRSASIWTRLLGVEHTVIDSVEAEEDDGAQACAEDTVIVAHARPAKRRRQRCGVCERRCTRFDNGEGRRRWRALDLGVIRAFIEVMRI
ncbi:hypothetical protein [Kitasatospora sp. NPDC093102]|uniref:hypothetical protein n=1 Tax=Kitasatospora sp. NPDC093102 TaxID=3155069 RepID=UPI003423456C